MTLSLIPDEVLKTLLDTAQSTPAGCWVEVGVYLGGSARALYGARHGRHLHLFDTFTGIPSFEPDKGDRHRIGEFHARGVLADLRRMMPAAAFHVGVFPDTLPDDLRGIAFAHVDCDQDPQHQ